MADLTITHEGSAKVANFTYWSLDELADAAKARPSGWAEPRAFNEYTSLEDAVKLAKEGWTDHPTSILDLAEHAVTMCEQEHEQFTFSPVFDVAGSDVEIGRYLSGEPECMVDYPLTVTSKVGRVITLCASVGYSSSVSTETMIRRGTMITALALALMKLGHAVELWADTSSTRGPNGNRIRIRTLVKGANDVIDPERIAFAFAHPGMLRQLCFAIKAHPDITGFRDCQPNNLKPIAPKEDLPEGAIYLPEVRTSHDVPEAAEELRRYLDELGLLAS